MTRFEYANSAQRKTKKNPTMNSNLNRFCRSVWVQWIRDGNLCATVLHNNNGALAGVFVEWATVAVRLAENNISEYWMQFTYLWYTDAPMEYTLKSATQHRNAQSSHFHIYYHQITIWIWFACMFVGSLNSTRSQIVVHCLIDSNFGKIPGKKEQPTITVRRKNKNRATLEQKKIKVWIRLFQRKMPHFGYH